MDTEAQARAYSEADFTAPHDLFVATYLRHFGPPAPDRRVLDLGCGPADVTVRFARACPDCGVDGVDASAWMLEFARRRLDAEGLGSRIRLFQAHIPRDPLPAPRYDALISNSLLHHLRDPLDLWRTLSGHAATGAPLFVMDLRRPEDETALAALVERYAGDAPPVLREDFANSLRAAYREDEVRAQIAAAGLEGLRVERNSDRHFVAYGRHEGRKG